MSIEKLDFQKVTQEKTPYTVILNSVIQNIKDPLSGFIWIYLYSHSGDWEIIKKHLQKKFKIGNNKLKLIFSYLKRANLITYVEKRNKDGTIQGKNMRVLCGDKFLANVGYIEVSSRGSEIEPVVNSAGLSRGSIIHPLDNQTSGSGPLLKETDYKRKEKAKKKEALSVDNCLMSEEQKELCNRKNVSWHEVWCKFVSFYGVQEALRTTWIIRLTKWVINENPPTAKRRNEPRSTVREWGPGHPDYDRQNRRT